MDLSRSKTTIFTKSIKRSMNICSQITNMNHMSIEDIEINLEELNRLCDHDGVIPAIVNCKYHHQIIDLLKHNEPKVKRTTLNILLKIIKNTDENSFILSVTYIICDLLEQVNDGLTFESCLGFLADIYKEGFNNVLSIDDQRKLRDSIITSFIWSSQNAVYNSLFLLYNIQDSDKVISDFYLIKIEELALKLRTGSGIMYEKLGILICKSLLRALDKLEIDNFEDISASSLDGTLIKMLFQSHMTLSADYFSIVFKLLCKILYFPNKTDASIYSISQESYAYIVIQRYQSDIATFLFDSLRRYNVKEISIFGFQLFYLILTIPKSPQKLLNETNQECWIQFIIDVLRNNLNCSESINWCFRVINRIIILNPKLIQLTENRFYSYDLTLDSLLIQIFYSARELSPASICASCDIVSTLSTYSEKIQNHFLEVQIHTLIHNMIVKHFVTSALNKESEYQIRLSTTNAMKSLILYNLAAKELFYNEEVQYNDAKQFLISSNLHNHGNEPYEESLAAYILFLASLTEYYPIKYDLMQNLQSALQRLILCDRCLRSASIIEAFQELLIVLSGLENESSFLLEILSVEKCCELASTFLNVYAIQKNNLIYLQLNVNKTATPKMLISVGEMISRAVKLFENSSIIKAEACVLIQIYIKKNPEFTSICVDLNLDNILFETICLNHNEELVTIGLQAFYVLTESSKIREKIILKAVKECNLKLLQCIIAIGSNLCDISNGILLNAVKQKDEALSYNLVLFLINNGCKPNLYLLKCSFEANNYSSAFLLLRLYGIHDSDEGFQINWSGLDMKHFNISWLADLSKQFPAKIDSNILWLSKRIKAESKNRMLLRNHYETCQNTLDRLFRYPQTQIRTLDKDIGGYKYYTRIKNGIPIRRSVIEKRTHLNNISLQEPIMSIPGKLDLKTLRENTRSNEFDWLNKHSIKEKAYKFSYQPVPGEVKEFVTAFRCGMDYNYHPLDPRCILEKQNKDEVDTNTCQIIHDFPESSLHFSINIAKSGDNSGNSFVNQLTETQDSSDSEIKHDINQICCLNLSKNKLSDLEDFVFPSNDSKFTRIFKYLTTLRLEKNSIRLIPENAFQSMSVLNHLDLSENKLTVIPWFIFKFCPLKYLNLNKNKIENFHLSTLEKSDLTSHNKVNYLSQFLLSDNKFKQFDFELFSIFPELRILEINCIGINETENHCLPISHLKSISMKKNSIINISENFLKLSKNIELLNFSENLIAPTEISLTINLSLFENLVNVDLNHNNLACSGPYFIPICILKIPNLQDIDMSYNNITEFPPCHMWASKNLQDMNFSHNKIQNLNLLNAKTNFQNLNILDLSFNLIKRIPAEIGYLSKLTLLNISHNPKLTTLPDEIGLLRYKNLNSLVRDGIHLNIPKYINQDAQLRELLKYYYDRLNQSVEYNEIKLVILGFNGRGKTSLLNSLQGKKSKIKKSSNSSNFEVSSWKLQSRQSGRTFEYQLICWDITNQEGLNSFHECYLSQRAFYIIVFDMTKEIEEINILRPLLWNIKSQAPHAPILIVGTHLDILKSNERSSRCLFLRNTLKKLCMTPGLPKIADVEFVDSRSPNPSIITLKNKIGAVLCSHRFINDQTLIEKQPSYYLKLSEILKDCLKTLPANCSILTEKEVKNLLTKHKLNLNDNELKLAVQFLHDSGIIVHFNDTLENLNNLYFLKPQWICSMISKTLLMPSLNTFTHNGMITLEDFITLFETNTDVLLSGNTKNKIQVVQCLKVLEKYNVIFQSLNNEVIIPSKLPINPPTKLSECLNSSKISRIYEFLFLPAGFWPRLLTKISVLSKAFDHLFDVYKLELSSWRTGVIISMEQSIHLVLEGKQEIGNNKEIIEISVTKSELGIKILVYIIDCIEVIIDEWYPGLTDDDLQGNKVITCYAVCPDCNTKIPLIDIVKNSMKSEFVCEFGHHTSIRIIAPDMVFGDLPNDLLTIPSELEVVKSKENLIGIGGNGCVYKGFYKGINCAVKYINNIDYSIEQPAYRLLRQEIDILRRFQHPSLISMLAADREKIVLEFAPMKDLKFILQTYKNLSKCLLQRIAFQVISGIQYLHFNYIIYRDIKMQNVLVFSLELSSPINVKIADYGISREVCPWGFIIPQGTPGYQAPEVLERSTSYKLSADIYSFGILLFNIATRGRHPADLKAHWRAGKQIELISEYQTNIWPRMQDCINKCTYLVPEDRPNAKEISDFIRCPTFMTIKSVLPLTHQTRIECMVSMLNSNKTLDVFIANGNQIKQEVRCIDIISGNSKGKPFLQNNNSNRILSMMVFSEVIFLGTLNGELWVYKHKENIILSSHITFQDSIISMLVINAPDKSIILMLGLINGTINYKLNFISIFDININDFEEIKLSEAPVTNLYLTNDLIFATSGFEIYKICFNQMDGNFEYDKVLELDSNNQDQLIKCFYPFIENINGNLTVQFYFTIRNDSLIYNYDDQGNQLKPEINCTKLIKEKLNITTKRYSSRIMCLTIWSGCRYICAGTGNGFLVIIDQKINHTLILSLFKNPIITVQVCKLHENPIDVNNEMNKSEINSKSEVIDRLSSFKDESRKMHNQNTSLLVVGNGYKSIGEDSFKGAVLIVLSDDISKVSQRLDEHIKSRNDIL